MARARGALATLLWLVAGAAACVLSAAALLRALDVDAGAEPTRTLLEAAGVLSLDALARVAPTGATAAQALLVWGAAAVVWLALGWLLDRLVRSTAARR